MVHGSLQGRPSKVNSHHSGPMVYMKHRRALYYLQLASEEARLCESVAFVWCLHASRPIVLLHCPRHHLDITTTPRQHLALARHS